MKAFILIIAIVSTLMFTGCEKNEEYNPQDQTQRLQLHAPFTPMESATRLSTDPTGKVIWDANDQLSVFIADTQTPDQWTNYLFTTDAEQAPKSFFVAQTPHPTLDATHRYNWFIMHPYVADAKTPTDAGLYTLGIQTQDFTSPLQHLTQWDLMTGHPANVGGNSVLFTTLKHLTTLLTFHITNNRSKPITITQVQLHGPERAVLSGRFTIDFGRGQLTPYEVHTHVAVLNVSNAQPLSQGESHTYYVVAVPFDIRVNETFSVDLTTDQGAVKFKATFPSQIFFKKGQINRQELIIEEQI